jgi:hypothetical protein
LRTSGIGNIAADEVLKYFLLQKLRVGQYVRKGKRFRGSRGPFLSEHNRKRDSISVKEVITMPRGRGFSGGGRNFFGAGFWFRGAYSPYPSGGMQYPVWGRGRGNPYPFCSLRSVVYGVNHRFYPWLPRRWWASGMYPPPAQPVYHYNMPVPAPYVPQGAYASV